MREFWSRIKHWNPGRMNPIYTCITKTLVYINHFLQPSNNKVTCMENSPGLMNPHNL